MSYQGELDAALTAARAAGKLLASEYARFQKISDAPANITTEADRMSQEVILQRLSMAFPEDGFCAEEDTPTLKRLRKSGTRLWIIDPIDGTRGFARKNGEFSVMIGLVDNQKIAVGVVLQPATARITFAARGEGCWRLDNDATEPTICNVGNNNCLSEATLTQSHSKEPNQPSRAASVLQPQRVIESYSAGIKLALVARGEADIYANTYPCFSDWDICAGHILVEEAGGRVSGLRGEDIVYSGEPGGQQTGLLATNGMLHEECIEKGVRTL